MTATDVIKAVDAAILPLLKLLDDGPIDIPGPQGPAVSTYTYIRDGNHPLGFQVVISRAAASVQVSTAAPST